MKPAKETRSRATQGWLKKAVEDLVLADLILKQKPPFCGYVLFHCQQAIEKSFKAFLTWHDVKFKKTHDLGELGGQCVTIDPSLELMAREAKPLSDYAWEFRYPSEDEEPTLAQANEAIEVAQRLFDQICARLPKETLPRKSARTSHRAKVSR